MTIIHTNHLREYMITHIEDKLNHYLMIYNFKKDNYFQMNNILINKKDKVSRDKIKEKNIFNKLH
jgi:hypothetical protein